MDFSLSDEQASMQEATARILADLFPLDRVRGMCASTASIRDDGPTWRNLCEHGLNGLIVSQEHGGLGLGLLDAALVAEQLGRHVAPLPFVANAIMVPLALASSGNRALQSEWLPKIAAGRTLAGVALSEHAAGARGDMGVDFADGVLQGSSFFAMDARAAGFFLVADRSGSVHFVESDSPGLSRIELETVDLTRSVCKLGFDKVRSIPLGDRSSGILERMVAAGRVILAADTLGCASRMLETAIEYAGQRVQFGRPIGSFQAIKHQCAELAAELEPGRAFVWYAAHAQDQDLDDAALATLHCKAYLSEIGRTVARRATEIHGGIGITDALGLHYWFKRIGWNYQAMGSPERLREEAARLQQG